MKMLYYQNNLYIQSNPHQNSKDIPHRHMEAQKIENSQGNTEQKEQHWRYNNTQL
jgi:hypothetical protein